MESRIYLNFENITILTEIQTKYDVGFLLQISSKEMEIVDILEQKTNDFFFKVLNRQLKDTYKICFH